MPPCVRCTEPRRCAVISAREIARAIGKPAPTPQQERVIESPLGPGLVIAGAGSGKTETMASRVLYLLANRQARAESILGLTFTRKAAGELGARIRERIGQLAESGLVELDYDPFDPPVVSTYNAFANGLYREHAVLLGREPDGVVLGEASAWQLARSIVAASDDPRLPRLDKSLDAVTEAVLALSRALGENVARADDVREMARQFSALAELPPGGRGEYAEALAIVRSIEALPVLLDLADRYAREKRRSGFVEFSDQVALALEAVRSDPSVADELRARFSVVLLDEYQDTSVVQSMLLAELFAGHPVMAVGDPHQSIYGWRGASASNLEEFPERFADGRAERFGLSMSWRNGRAVLEVANAVIEPLAEAAVVDVERLEPSPLASDVPVSVAVEETIEEEAERVATWLGDAIATAQGAEPPSAALLLRTRAHQEEFLAALRRHGVRYHVLGVGGLLAEPEIADLVCALTVIDDPQAGSELVRLLAGSRWRVGPRDLRVLRELGRWLAGRDHALRRLGDDVREGLRASLSDDEAVSIVDALDFVAYARDGHPELQRFSEAGLSRLRDAGRTFSRLRALAHGEVSELVAAVYEALRLDIEVLANETRTSPGAALEAFLDAVDDYHAIARDPRLGGFLSWLRQAARRDNLAPRPEEPEPGTVQVLTIHGAKGLEWDHVAVPRLVEDELPARAREGYSGWLRFGELPYEFRGDAAQLPVFAWRGATSRKELCAERKRFAAALRERHELEERRLFYVAVTRARHGLLLSASFWAGHSSVRVPSRFLTELADLGVVPALPSTSAHDSDPSGGRQELMTWPRDPLGGRRARVERAAEAVRRAEPGNEGEWERELDALLAERRARLAGDERVLLPRRVPASRFKDYVTDPERVARGLRRPLPTRPHREARLGTLFHEWVERRSTPQGGARPFDELDAELTGPSAADAELAPLIRNFEGSPWAARTPAEVEREIHFSLGETVVVCKLDAVYVSGDRHEIVDWKTGEPPRSPDEQELRDLQLALYRVAYARWAGLDLERVDACFYYVAADRIIAPARLPDEEELLRLWPGSALAASTLAARV